MKFHISPPPAPSDNTKEYLTNLSSWLYSLAEGLNVTLNCLSPENFGADTRAVFDQINERTKDSDI
ncbi:MAG: hypothetical protein PUC29_08070 [Clostridia bacterium]|nr:hypothetical protein [Clostridia bacterium]